MNIYVAMSNDIYFVPLAGPFSDWGLAVEAIPYLRVLMDAQAPRTRDRAIEPMLMTISEPGFCNKWIGLPL